MRSRLQDHVGDKMTSRIKETDEVCRNCRFNTAVICKRFPPTYWPGRGWVQPDVKPDDSCGEFKALNKVKQEEVVEEKLYNKLLAEIPPENIFKGMRLISYLGTFGTVINLSKSISHHDELLITIHWDNNKQSKTLHSDGTFVKVA